MVSGQRVRLQSNCTRRTSEHAVGQPPMPGSGTWEFVGTTQPIWSHDNDTHGGRKAPPSEERGLEQYELDSIAE